MKDYGYCIGKNFIDPIYGCGVKTTTDIDHKFDDGFCLDDSKKVSFDKDLYRTAKLHVCSYCHKCKTFLVLFN